MRLCGLQSKFLGNGKSLAPAGIGTLDSLVCCLVIVLTTLSQLQIFIFHFHEYGTLIKYYKRTLWLVPIQCSFSLRPHWNCFTERVSVYLGLVSCIVFTAHNSNKGKECVKLHLNTIILCITYKMWPHLLVADLTYHVNNCLCLVFGGEGGGEIHDIL